MRLKGRINVKETIAKKYSSRQVDNIVTSLFFGVAMGKYASISILARGHCRKGCALNDNQTSHEVDNLIYRCASE